MLLLLLFGGEPGRDGGWRVGGCDEDPGALTACFFLIFLRAADSLPEASDASGEPGRLRLVLEEVRGRPGFGEGYLDGRWEGVLFPLEEAPEPVPSRCLDFDSRDLSFLSSFSGVVLLAASALAFSASLAFSVSVESESDYIHCVSMGYPVKGSQKNHLA